VKREALRDFLPQYAKAFAPDECAVLERLLAGADDETLARILGDLEIASDLSDALESLPEVSSAQTLGSKTRSGATLVARICDSPRLGRSLYVPSRAFVWRSWMMAKIQFFLKLSYLFGAGGEASSCLAAAKGCVHLVTTEEVFQYVAEDVALPRPVREKAVYSILDLWDRKEASEGHSCGRILSMLWDARAELEPVYGTMIGTMEIVTLCQRNGIELSDFLGSARESGTFEALEEFMFALTREEILVVRDSIADRGLASASAIPSILGARTYEDGFEDPREMFSFCMARKKEAVRRRTCGAPGPERIIEELFARPILESGASLER